MSVDRNLLQQYLDGLSVRELRELSECFLNAYVFRPASLPEQKLKARSEQKQLAELLARTDANWTVREVVLNTGRALYYSSNPHHNYYTERLCELVQKAADKLGRSSEGKAFASAVDRHEKLFAQATGGIWGGEIFDSNEDVVTRASSLIEAAISKLGADFFSKSERKALTGIVTTELARSLNAA